MQSELQGKNNQIRKLKNLFIQKNNKNKNYDKDLINKININILMYISQIYLTNIIQNTSIYLWNSVNFSNDSFYPQTESFADNNYKFCTKYKKIILLRH